MDEYAPWRSPFVVLWLSIAVQERAHVGLAIPRDIEYEQTWKIRKNDD